jgi:hypothetical protein
VQGSYACEMNEDGPIIAILVGYWSLLLLHRCWLGCRGLSEHWRVAGLCSMLLPAEEGHSPGLAT